MAQVITFFGWLVIGICFTVVIFGHTSIAFVYGFDRLLADMFPSEGMSSLVFLLVAPLPGSALLGIGKLMKRYDDRLAAREAGEETADAANGEDAHKA